MIDAPSIPHVDHKSFHDEFLNQTAGLLIAAVAFSGADEGYLISVDQERIFPVLAETVEGDVVIRPTTEARLDPHQSAIIYKTIASGVSFKGHQRESDCSAEGMATLDSAHSIICIPMWSHGRVSSLLYLEIRRKERFFHEHVFAGLELFSVALEKALLLTSRGAMDKEVTAEILMGVDPAVLHGVSASIALQISDPLSAIVAHASAGLQWLNQEQPLIENARSSLRKIASSAFKIGGITSSYRYLADPTASPQSVFDLYETVLEAAQLLHLELETCGAELALNLDKGSIVFGEPRQVLQVVVNLISVAMETMSDAGKPAVLTICSGYRENDLVLGFSNSGSQIPYEARDAIFDPSYSDKYGTRGIKLAVARTIAQLQGGGLDIIRSDSNDTMMLLRLPRPITT